MGRRNIAISRRPARERSGSGGAGAPAALALDGLSAAPLGWWNCARRDFTAYVGPLIRVQRTSDLAQQDIGYTVANVLDVAALATFCAATTGRVITFYDQSGNAKHLTNATHTQQPVIFAAGAVVLLGTKPGMDFDGVTNYLTRADACGLTGAPALTFVCVAAADNYSPAKHVYQFGRESPGSGGFAIRPFFEAATLMARDCVGAYQRFTVTSGVLAAPHYTIGSQAAGAGIGDGAFEINGVPQVESSELAPATVLSLLDQRTTLGSGWSGVANRHFDGRVTALGAWGSVLAGADLVQVRAACAGVAAFATAFDAVGPTLVNEWDAALSPIVMGAGVQNIGDLRGGKDLEQLTPARQPALVIDGLRSFLLADGIDDFLANATMALSGDLTFLCVARLVSNVGAAPHNILNFGNAAGVIQQTNAAGFRAALDDSIGQEIINDGPTDFNLHAFVLRNAVGSSRKLYVDGGAGVAGARTLGMDPITVAGVFANAVTVASFGNVELYWWGIVQPSLSLPALNAWGAWAALRFGVPWVAAT